MLTSGVGRGRALDELADGEGLGVVVGEGDLLRVGLSVGEGLGGTTTALVWVGRGVVALRVREGLWVGLGAFVGVAWATGTTARVGWTAGIVGPMNGALVVACGVGRTSAAGRMLTGEPIRHASPVPTSAMHAQTSMATSLRRAVQPLERGAGALRCRGSSRTTGMG
jgi:hypothetical protein